MESMASVHLEDQNIKQRKKIRPSVLAGWMGGFLVVGLILMAVFAKQLSPYDPA